MSTQKSELSVLGRCAPHTSVPSKGSSHVSDLGCHEKWMCTSQEVDMQLPDPEVEVNRPGS